MTSTATDTPKSDLLDTVIIAHGDLRRSGGAALSDLGCRLRA
jgi:hypothetical protein